MPNQTAPLKVTIYGSSNSEQVSKLDNSLLNDSSKTIERVKTSFNVTNDENQRKVANTKNFVESLKALNNPKLMKELTPVIQSIKQAST